jgi:hypothetical protein
MKRALSREQIAAKKERRAQQAEKNMTRYRNQQQATIDKTARLRAQRLAIATTPVTGASRSNNDEPRGPLVELHNGVRG